MNYIKEIFGCDLVDINFELIEIYFTTEKSESNILEFKSIDDSKIEKKDYDDVLKSICGFLNSEGGIILWGSPRGEKVDDQKEKIFKGKLTPTFSSIEKDSFINKVSDSIEPFPSNIKLHEIEKGGNKVYIIQVEKSEYSPHQFKNIYYMRLDGQTRPAPHHYVEALFKKISYPKLNGFLKIQNYRILNKGVHEFQVRFFIFNLSKNQNEHEVFLRLNLGGGCIFSKSQIPIGRSGYSTNGSEFILPENQSTLYYNQPLSHHEIIHFNPNFDSNIRFSFEFSALFGGKNSPLLCSLYEIKIPSQSVVGKDFNSLIIESKENVLYSENNTENLTELEKIELLLDRKLL